MSSQGLEKYIMKYNFAYCGESSKYQKISKVGQGTFGEVFKARDTTDAKIVAMKKIIIEDQTEGFPITALREIRIFQSLKHENVVKLIEICHTKGTQSTRYLPTYYLVLEFCDYDLAKLISNTKLTFRFSDIKTIMQQLLHGLYYIHSNNILHRDIKPANILITKNGVLKLADFGLSRAFSASKSDKENRYTNRVVTIWYRPPELLLGDRNYGPPIDLWGAGCIMAEMWTKSPIMQGNSEQQQLTLISKFCGLITTEVWPSVKSLDLFNKIDLPKVQQKRGIERLKTYIKDAFACDLLEKLLVLDPSKRYDADSALDHDFFYTDPLPSDLGKILTQHSQSTLESHTLSRRPARHMQHPYHPISTGTTRPTVSRTYDGYQDRIY
ncbi:GSCOCG00007837001-RA-CDS [Cotesia congregata]|nr:GSCOCG00007837001-RA-CDS [Cotesia congregata]